MKTSNILIVIFVPISVLLLLVLLFYLFIIVLHKKFKKYYDDLKHILDHEPYNETKTKLSTVDANLKKLKDNLNSQLSKKDLSDTNNLQHDIVNQKLKEISRDMNKFADCLNEINKNISKLRKLRTKGCSFLEKKQYYQTWKNVLEIKKVKLEINHISESVENKTSDYIDEYQEMGKQHYHLQQINRKIDQIIDTWIKEGVEDEFKKILIQKKEYFEQQQESLFELIGERKIDNQFRNDFNTYKKTMYYFLDFANQYDKFKSVIFVEVPNGVHHLQNYINNVKQRIKNDLNYLDVDKYFANIDTLYLEIKKQFYEFKISDLSNKINQLFVRIADLNTIVNNESSAYNFIHEKKLWIFLKTSYKQLIENYILIKEKIEDAISIDKNFFSWLNDDLDELTQMIQRIEELNKYIETNKNEQSISAMTKQFKIKSFIFIIKSFNEKYYEIKRNINLFYAQGKSPRIKFFKMKQLFLSSCVQLNEKNIKLSPKEKNFVNELENKKIQIDDLIISNKEDVENEINENINEFQNMFANFLNNINKKLVYSKIYIYISEKFSCLRLDNPNIDHAFIRSKNEYLSGDYKSSIETVVSAINKGVN